MYQTRFEGLLRNIKNWILEKRTLREYDVKENV